MGIHFVELIGEVVAPNATGCLELCLSNFRLRADPSNDGGERKRDALFVEEKLWQH